MNQNDEYQYREINNLLENIRMRMDIYFFKHHEIDSKALKDALAISTKIERLRKDIQVLIEEGIIERQQSN